MADTLVKYFFTLSTKKKKRDENVQLLSNFTKLL